MTPFKTLRDCLSYRSSPLTGDLRPALKRTRNNTRWPHALRFGSAETSTIAQLGR